MIVQSIDEYLQSIDFRTLYVLESYLHIAVPGIFAF